MARQAAILALARALRSASDGADWPALATADRTMARDLRNMAALGQWNENERKALLTLRNVHAAAYKNCSEAKDRLGLHLSTMQSNKEGFLAYALNSDTDTNGNPA